MLFQRQLSMIYECIYLSSIATKSFQLFWVLTGLNISNFKLAEYATSYNSTYKKLAIQRSADTFVVNGNWFSATIFVLTGANFL
jgi:hypothetical protein